MKKPILLFVMALMTFGAVMAQDKITDSDYCVFQDNAILQYVDGKPTKISATVTLKDGSTVSPEGVHTNKKGKTMQMNDGECVGMSGKKYKNEEALFVHLQKEKKKLLKKMKK